MKFTTSREDPQGDLWSDPEFVDAYMDAVCRDFEERQAAAGAEDAVAEAEDVGPPDAVFDPLEDAVFFARRSRQSAAEQDRLFQQVLADAAADPTPWVGPDPAEDPTWEPPRGITRKLFRERRRLIAMRAAAADLAVRVHLSDLQVRARAHRADMLARRCPNLWTAYLAGDVAEQNATCAAQLADALPARAKKAHKKFDKALAEAATRLVPGKFRTRAHATWERVHPENTADRHARARKDREVRVRPESNGMSVLTALLPAVDAAGIDERLDQHARHLRSLPDEDRTLAQLRADTFIDLLVRAGCTIAGSGDGDASASADDDDGVVTPETDEAGATTGETGDDGATTGTADSTGADDTTTGAGDTTTGTATGADDDACGPERHRSGCAGGTTAVVRITIPALTLLGHSDELATLDGHGPIDLDTARELAGDATSWIRVLTHPITGTVLDVERRPYRVSKALRRWAGIRYPTCVFPGCSRPSPRCDMDHRRRWADGGATTAENIEPLCESHHSVKDESLWRLTRRGTTGDLTWTSPTGIHTDVDPPPF